MKVYVNMIRPIMEYCAFITDGGPVWFARKLQVLQNDALRIAERTRDPRDADVNDLHELHELEFLQPRRDRQLLSLMYDYSKDENNVIIPVRALRGNIMVQLKTSRLHKDIYSKSPLYRGRLLWDLLTHDQQHEETRASFQQALT